MRRQNESRGALPGGVSPAKSCNRWVLKLCHNIFRYIKSLPVKFGDQTIACLDVVNIGSAPLREESESRGEQTLKLCHTKSFDRLGRKFCHIAFEHIESIQIKFGDLNIAGVGTRQNASQLPEACMLSCSHWVKASSLELPIPMHACATSSSYLASSSSRSSSCLVYERASCTASAVHFKFWRR